MILECFLAHSHVLDFMVTGFHTRKVLYSGVGRARDTEVFGKVMESCRISVQFVQM